VVAVYPGTSPLTELRRATDFSVFLALHVLGLSGNFQALHLQKLEAPI
jgi:hypothetical protein